MKKQRSINLANKSVATLAFVLAALGVAVSPAAAATIATPEAAVPGGSVSIAPDDECAAVWKELANAGDEYGAIVVAWPDGTETILGPPLPNPATVTVPAGMPTGEAKITVHKGLVNGTPSGSIAGCEGAFKITKDATVPVASAGVAAALALAGGAGAWSIAKNRRREAGA